MISFLLGLFSPIIVIGLYIGIMNLYGNIRVQNKGKFIRSAQLSEKRFENLIKKHKVKTVINLRGTDDAPHEKEICEKKGIFYVGDIEWDSDEIPSEESLNKMVNILETCEEPVYVHCLGGADRSGEIAAMYYTIREKYSIDKALKSLSILYGHMAWKRPAKRYFIMKVWRYDNN